MAKNEAAPAWPVASPNPAAAPSAPLAVDAAGDPILDASGTPVDTAVSRTPNPHGPLSADQLRPSPGRPADFGKTGANADGATTRRFKIIRGQYARREFNPGDKEGTFVHYRAGTPLDTLDMTEKEADKFGRRFLVEVSSGGIAKPNADQAAYLENQRKLSEAAKAKAAKEGNRGG